MIECANASWSDEYQEFLLDDISEEKTSLALRAMEGELSRHVLKEGIKGQSVISILVSYGIIDFDHGRQIGADQLRGVIENLCKKAQTLDRISKITRQAGP